MEDCENFRTVSLNIFSSSENSKQGPGCILLTLVELSTDAKVLRKDRRSFSLEKGVRGRKMFP